MQCALCCVCTALVCRLPGRFLNTHARDLNSQTYLVLYVRRELDASALASISVVGRRNITVANICNAAYSMVFAVP